MTQAEALNILKSGANVFLSGEPGSGKTHTIGKYIEYLTAAGVEVAVTASTGIAATHLGGLTIHSWSGIGIKKFLSQADLDQIIHKESLVKRVVKTKVLVIDEVSMLPAAVLDSVDLVCRALKKSPEPFGGLQVIFVGDFFQLPPVYRQGEVKSEFAFTAEAWQSADPVVCYLSEQHRQEDSDFLEILSAIRSNTVAASHRNRLDVRVQESKTSAALAFITKLFPHNENVDRLNETELARLPDEAKAYQMTSMGNKKFVSQLQQGCLSPEILNLKKGARVMFTKNSPSGAFVNGTMGEVEGFDDEEDFPLVRLKNGKLVQVQPMEWSMEENGRIRARIFQIPLRLAWAITIHKSQGASLEFAYIDLQNAFVEGQGYVALSRLRKLEGLFLKGYNDKALAVHPLVLEQDRLFRQKSAEAGNKFLNLSAQELDKLHKDFLTDCGGQSQAESFNNKPKRVYPWLDKSYSVAKVRERYPHAYEPWTGEEEGKLKEYFLSGTAKSEICRLLGRQPGGVNSRLKLIGLIED